MLQTFWKTEIGSCSVTPLRARPHLWAAFLQAQSGAGRCEANAWAMDVSSWLIGPQKSKCLGVPSRRFFVNAKVVIVSCQHAMKLPLVPLRWCFCWAISEDPMSRNAQRVRWMKQFHLLTPYSEQFSQAPCWNKILVSTRVDLDKHDRQIFMSGSFCWMESHFCWVSQLNISSCYLSCPVDMPHVT